MKLYILFFFRKLFLKIKIELILKTDNDKVVKLYYVYSVFILNFVVFNNMINNVVIDLVIIIV